MTFEEVIRQAAHDAELAGIRTMEKWKRRHVVDEDDLNNVLITNLDTAFDRHQIGGITFASSIVRRRRGIASQESRLGADIGL